MSQKKKILRTIILLAVVYLILAATFPLINSSVFLEMVKNAGYFAPVLFILITVLSHVIAPLAGTPFVILAISLYGYLDTLFLVYIAGMISATINFYIARKFGRRWVEKLAGKDSMKKIDEFTTVSGKKALILARVFGFSVFEFVSYAAGFTNMPFKDYFIITAVFASIPGVVMYIAFKNFDFDSTRGMFVWLITMIAAGVIFVYFVSKLLKRKSNSN
jgi:uncharacterized membrane protein YdjX (TVP38/TMEM64 family)